jgi:hypothetical protein
MLGTAMTDIYRLPGDLCQPGWRTDLDESDRENSSLVGTMELETERRLTSK